MEGGEHDEALEKDGADPLGSVDEVIGALDSQNKFEGCFNLCSRLGD